MKNKEYKGKALQSHILFSRNNGKRIIDLSSAEIAQRVLRFQKEKKMCDNLDVVVYLLSVILLI